MVNIVVPFYIYAIFFNHGLCHQNIRFGSLFVFLFSCDELFFGVKIIMLFPDMSSSYPLGAPLSVIKHGIKYHHVAMIMKYLGRYYTVRLYLLWRVIENGVETKFSFLAPFQIMTCRPVSPSIKNDQIGFMVEVA